MESTKVKEAEELRQFISFAISEEGRLTGVGKVEDGLVILLNPDAILTLDEKTAVSPLYTPAPIGGDVY